MAIKRRFQGWRLKKTGEAVKEGDSLKELSTGDYYILKGFSFSQGQRLKVLHFDKRVTGIPEFRPCEDFGVEYV